MIPLLTLLLACTGAEPAGEPQPATPPVEQPAPDPTTQAIDAWTALTAAIGTPQAPRALMDHVDAQVLGLHPPLQVAQVLERFVSGWGRDALGTGQPQSRVEGDIVHLSWVGTDPQGRPVAVHVQARDGRILSLGVDPQPGRQPPVLHALELSVERMATAPPPTATVDPQTGEPLVLPGGVGDPGQPQVLVEDVRAEAPLERDVAWAALGPLLDAAHACYTERLDQGATIAGTLRLRVELAEDGTVSAINRQGQALDLGLDGCTRKALESLGHAEQEGPSAYEVSLRFVMPPEEDTEGDGEEPTEQPTEETVEQPAGEEAAPGAEPASVPPPGDP